MHNFPLIVLILLLGACGEPEMPSPFHAIDVSWQYPQADFKLTDFNGKPRSLLDFKDKVMVLYFGYTHCPEVCPTTLSRLTQTLRLLGQDADKVQVIFITLDPERDSPALLAKFIPSFDPSFLGLRGDAQATAQAARAFGVSYVKQYDKRGGYTLDHTDVLFLLGLRGKPLLLSHNGQSPDQVLDDVRLLLAIGR